MSDNKVLHKCSTCLKSYKSESMLKKHKCKKASSDNQEDAVKKNELTNKILAQQKVNEWQKNGYRAYFERYLVNNRPSYKVKLWGFESKDQAAKEAKKLQTAYKFEFHVE